MSSISSERLVSVDANSRRSGFLPPHQSSAVSATSLPPQNAINYTTTPRQNKTPAEKPAGANHQPIPLHQLRLRRTDHPRLRTEVVFHVPLKVAVKRRGVQVVEESLMVNNTFTQITIKTDDDKTGFSESSAPGSCRSAWGCRSKETSPPHHVHHKRTECR